MKKFTYIAAIFALLSITLVSCTTEEIETYNEVQTKTNETSVQRVDIEPILMPLRPR